MATLAEAGLSQNLGITGPQINEARHPVVLLRDQYDLLSAKWQRQGSAFVVANGCEFNEGEVVLGRPTGFSVGFDEENRRHRRPVFTGIASQEQYTLSMSATSLFSSAEEASVTSREALDETLRSYKRGERRRHAVLLVGAESIRAFTRSSLLVLDIRSKVPMILDERGYHLTGEDIIASRIIQLASASGVDVSRSIPGAHAERALLEMVTTTLINHYVWLFPVRRATGAWHVGCENFARAYGISAAEIADLAILRSDEIRQAVQQRPNSARVPKITEDSALRMAEYLVEGH